MRIAQVIPYVSIDGAFGGPVAVAVAQSNELARRGHEVDVYAGWDGRSRFEPAVHDVRLFQARRFLPTGLSGLLAPGLARDLRTAASRYDVVHVHGGRDLTSIAAYASVDPSRLVVQSHGMITNARRVGNRLVDRIIVRRTLNAAMHVLTLTPAETDAIREIAPSANVLRINNGIARASDIDTQVPSDTPEVLFLARLHPRKNALVFAESARMLIAGGVGARFTVVGPDEGDGPRLRSFISTHGLQGRLSYEGPIPPGSAPERLSRAAIYVLPSNGEVYPMSVLEALSVGTPTILSRTCAIASDLASAGAVRLTDPTAEDIALQVRDLLSDRPARERLRNSGVRLTEESLSIYAVASTLEEAYSSPSRV